MLWSSVSERLEGYKCAYLYLNLHKDLGVCCKFECARRLGWAALTTRAPVSTTSRVCAAAPIKFKARAQKLCAVWMGLNWSIKLPSLLAVCRINRCILKVAAEVIYSALVTTDRQIQLQHSGLHTHSAGNWRMCWWRLFQIAALTKCVTRLSIKMTKPEATRAVI